MLDAKQIEELERAMIAEHRKDIEALSRLKRFLPNGTQHNDNTTAAPVARATSPRADDVATPALVLHEAKSLRAMVAEVMHSEPKQIWSAPNMVAYLQDSGVELAAKNPVPGIQLIMVHWQKRGKVSLVRKGTGRIPNLYQWTTGATLDGEEAAM